MVYKVKPIAVAQAMAALMFHKSAAAGQKNGQSDQKGILKRRISKEVKALNLQFSFFNLQLL
jgi:hypothetical protein